MRKEEIENIKQKEILIITVIAEMREKYKLK